MKVSKLASTQIFVSGNGQILRLIDGDTLDCVTISTAKSHFFINPNCQPKWSSTIGMIARDAGDGVSIDFKIYDETDQDDVYLAHHYTIDVYQREKDVDSKTVRVELIEQDADESGDQHAILKGVDDMNDIINIILAHIRNEMSSEY